MIFLYMSSTDHMTLVDLDVSPFLCNSLGESRHSGVVTNGLLEDTMSQCNSACNSCFSGVRECYHCINSGVS